LFSKLFILILFKAKLYTSFWSSTPVMSMLYLLAKINGIGEVPVQISSNFPVFFLLLTNSASNIESIENLNFSESWYIFKL